ncbi:MAG: OadG-related small transporter subunit [Eubacteriales bacterium]|nr:OadG-related small transporter subunit [Eubacteriales bacterium]
MTIMQAGWQLMLYGLGGVFLSLLMFYILMKVLVGVSKRISKQEK